MSRPAAKGWCPGAYKPMMSGDGLVVRVRPMLARLTQAQVLGLCATAQEFGSGLMDLTSRANLQIRGVAEADHEAVLARLADLGLLPDDPMLESRRNILIPPLWQAGDETDQIANALVARLGDFPELPAKMGFAIDIDGASQFTQNSADFRLERSCDGALILRADGASHGRLVTAETAVDALIEMANWFVKTDGPSHRRMAAHVALTPPPADWQDALPVAAAPALKPGRVELGTIFGAAFGQIEAEALATLVRETKAEALRVTPWRLFLLEGAATVETTDFITEARDPLLQTDACPGAPLCTSSTVETRRIARTLAKHTSGPLHISGCAKGCARPRPCATTLVGNDGAFDLVKNGRPWDAPTKTGLTPQQLTTALGEF
ncbi:cobalamin biosynthesis protein CobG [Shimia sp. R10_1]|uniref:cobalamin biosynthesis protein CobG n=1 Tax=Shimia sp. R10_1 TaxID=2821095 RepID=UPI001AD9EFFC|nr:cobalamin biosynthesis protein CobG [Shimia sp. R10_1]MBO9472669.1 cobalamin biosynthesis protein CobG [Shimia sp. R10_1]